MSAVPPGPPNAKANAKADRRDPIHVIEVRAAAGDVAGVMDFWLYAPPAVYDLRQLDWLLRQAIRNASHKPLQEFAAVTYRQAITFLLEMLVRLQGCMLHSGMTGDASNSARRFQIPGNTLGELLPVIERLSRLVGDLNLSWASANRLCILAERGKGPPRGRRKRRRPDDDLPRGGFATSRPGPI
jgi:hypothetical protein